MSKKCNFCTIISIILLGISVFGIGVSAQVGNNVTRQEFEQYKEKRTELLTATIKDFDKRSDDMSGNLVKVQTDLGLLREDVNRIKNVLEQFYFIVLGVFITSLSAGAFGTYGIMKNKQGKKT